MLRIFRFSILLSLMIPVVLSFSGCGPSEPGAKWTIQKGALDFTETLRLAEGEGFYFGEVYDVAVGEDGSIYVADGEAGHVKVVAPDGTVRDTIGQPGEGPGEFRYPNQLGFTSGDSLYVMDARGISVFSPEGDFEYSFNIVGGAGAPRNMMIPPEGGGAYFAYFPFPQQATEQAARAVVRHVGSNGSVGDTLFAVRPYQVSPEGLRIPFSRRSLFAMGPEGSIHHTWSGDLHVATYDQKGVKQRVIDIPFDPIPIRSEDRKNALKDRSKDERAAVREHIPDTQPAFEHFLVDDDGRYWFGRPTSHPDSTAWWVAIPKEQQVGTTTLPSKVQIMAVREGRAYGRTTTERGAPTLVQYKINLGI